MPIQNTLYIRQSHTEKYTLQENILTAESHLNPSYNE